MPAGSTEWLPLRAGSWLQLPQPEANQIGTALTNVKAPRDDPLSMIWSLVCAIGIFKRGIMNPVGIMEDKRVGPLPSAQMPLISILTAFLQAGHGREMGLMSARSLPCSLRAFTTFKMRLKRFAITPRMLLCWHIWAGMVMWVQNSSEWTENSPLLSIRELEVTEKTEAYCTRRQMQ